MALQIYLEIAHIHNRSIGPYTWAEVNMTKGPGIVLLPFWIATNLLNIYGSGALIYRIHQGAKRCQSFGTPAEDLLFVIRLIAESGVLYFPITLVHLFLWFSTNNFAIDIANTLNAPLLGIAFNWLIIRVSRSRAERAAKDDSEDITTIKFRKSGKHPQSVISSMGSTSDSASTVSVIDIVRVQTLVP